MGEGDRITCLKSYAMHVCRALLMLQLLFSLLWGGMEFWIPITVLYFPVVCLVVCVAFWHKPMAYKKFI